MYDVIIWSSQNLIREGWTAFLTTQGKLDIVGHGGPSPETLTLIRNLQPDVILLDIGLPWPEVSSAFSPMASVPRQVAMICVEAHVTHNLLSQLKSLGVKGCLSKQSSLVELVTVIYRVCHGHTSYAPPDTNIPTKGWNESFSNCHLLSKGEMEVVRYMVDGMGTPDIADRLSISYRTVEVHRHNVLKKLKCKNTRVLVNLLTGHQVS